MSRPHLPEWNRTAERELRDDVQGNLRTRERLFEQLWRMYERGPLGRRQAPAVRRELAIGYVGQGETVCALCDRDHWSILGNGLVLANDERATVCWVCGDEHNPALTAEVLASAVDTSETWIASRFPDYFSDWIHLLREHGMEQSALDLEAQVARYQEQVRRVKGAALGDAETWLSPAA